MANQKYSCQILCSNVPPLYDSGSLYLPEEFVIKYQNELVEEVKLVSPVGDHWLGTIQQCEHFRIVGLLDWSNFYKVKPCYLVLLEYTGRASFNFTIFNPYAVEINYPKLPITINHQRRTRGNSITMGICSDEVKNVKFDQLKALFSYSTGNKFDNLYKFDCEERHFQFAYKPEVIPKNVMKRYTGGMKPEHINIVFNSYTCPITLKWDGSFLRFGKGWSGFCRSLNLSVGDSVLFCRGGSCEEIKVVVFLKKEMESILELGAMKFVKRVDKTTMHQKYIKLPEMFLAFYRNTMSKVLKIWMADGTKYKIVYNYFEDKMCSLGTIIDMFHVQIGHYLVFYYLGASNFYLTIYNESGVDVIPFEKHETNASDVHNLIVLSSESEGLESDSSSGYHDHISSSDADMVERSDTYNTDSQSETEDDQIRYKGFPRNIDEAIFTVILKRSHLDGRAHGPYIPASLRNACFASIPNNTTTLTSVAGHFAVKLVVYDSVWRFGSGWDEVAINNNFKQGDRLCFTAYMWTEQITFTVKLID